MDSINIEKSIDNVNWLELHKDLVLNCGNNKKVIISRDGSHKVVVSDKSLCGFDDYIIGVLNCVTDIEIKDDIQQEALLEGDWDPLYEKWKDIIRSQYQQVIKYYSLINC